MHTPSLDYVVFKKGWNKYLCAPSIAFRSSLRSLHTVLLHLALLMESSAGELKVFFPVVSVKDPKSLENSGKKK